MAIPGVLPAIGSVVSSAMNLFGANSNRQWQEYMSSTAHQREVEDLKKAGLNPILSAYGKGASTPPGGYATVENPLREWDSNVNSAKAVSISKQGMDNQTRLADADIAVKLATAENVKAQTDLFKSQTSEIREAKIPLSLSQIGVNNANVSRLMRETEYLVGRINLLGSEQARNEAQAILSLAAAGRENASSAHISKQAELVDLQKAHQELQNVLTKYQIPRARNQSEVQDDLPNRPFGKFQPTIEGWIRTLSPFKP